MTPEQEARLRNALHWAVTIYNSHGIQFGEGSGGDFRFADVESLLAEVDRLRARDYTAEDVSVAMSVMLRHGKFGETPEAARRMASICAHELLAALSTEPKGESNG